MLLGLSLAAHAQAEQQKPAQPAQKKPAAKARKVWTNEDVGSLATPADLYLEKQQAQEEAAAKQAAASQPPADAKSAKLASHPPLLSNPKSAADADKMIDWEQRDIDAQQEYLGRLQKQLEEAPADDKERLQKLVQERIQIIADTRKEQDGLKAQRKALEKKPAAGNTATPPPQPPPQ
ncbi:MAG: hypothetical protein WAR21_13435 [Candidatus Acidiferrales bacterium]